MSPLPFFPLLVVRAEDKPVILVAEKLGDAGIELLESFATVDCSYDLTNEQLMAKMPLVDAVIIRSGTKITREVIEASKGRLQVVGRAGVGIDNVDLKAATENGCLVVNATTANTVAAAEHGIALICSLARNVAQADASVKKGEWKRNKYVGASLVGKTCAIIGFGKVGSEVGRRAVGLGMKVIAYDPYASAERARALGVELVDFDTALARGDFFSLHMPLLDSTRNLFNDDTLAKIKKGARIVNVARGGVIDEAALCRSLESGHVAGAALDVFDKEPVDMANPLIGREDVICTPHLGASTVEAQEAVAVEVAEAVVNALRGELAATAVNAPMVPKEVLAELQPYVSLAEGLGKAFVQLVEAGQGGMGPMTIEYTSGRADNLDTRLLRAMVLKGILEKITDKTVNLVNADYLAEEYGIDVTEKATKTSDKSLLSKMTLEVASPSKFTAAKNAKGNLSVSGAVVNGQAFVTAVGDNFVEVDMSETVLLCQQRDQPGVIGNVGLVLAKHDINISFMTVGRTSPRAQAVMAVGTDEPIAENVLGEIKQLSGIEECISLSFH